MAKFKVLTSVPVQPTRKGVPDEHLYVEGEIVELDVSTKKIDGVDVPNNPAEKSQADAWMKSGVLGPVKEK